MVDDGEGGADGVADIGNRAGVDVIAGHETNNIRVKGKLFVSIGIIRSTESKNSNTRQATLMLQFSKF